MKKAIAFVVCVMTLGLATEAFAQQRPLVTEDPETVGAGNILIEGGFDYQSDLFYPTSGLTGDLLRLPTLGVSFGLSSIAELQIDGGFYNRLAVTDRQPAPLSGALSFTGDTTTDVQTARNAGLKSILVRTGHGGRDGKQSAAPDFTFDDLLEAVRFIVQQGGAN